MTRAAAPVVALALLLAACGGKGGGTPAAAPKPPPESEAYAWVERKIAEGAVDEAVVVLESLVFADTDNAELLRPALTRTSQTRAQADEIADRLEPGFLYRVALARAYREVGRKEELLRALTLLQFALRDHPDLQWAEPGWIAKFEMCRTYLAYGRQFRDKTAFANVVVYIDTWVSLGLLRKPLPPEWQALYDEAKGQ
jgi:hypothetical protein